MINNFLISLLLTILVETIILFIVSISGSYDKDNFSNKNIIFAGITSSSLTLPYLYFIFPNFLSGIYFIIFGEIIVTLIESIFYMFFFRISFLKGFYISFLANFSSFIVGILLFW